MISAVVLAAGQSKRMGQQKMLLPWGNITVIEKVIETLLNSGIDDIHIVVGGSYKQIIKILREYQLEFIINKNYRNGEMLTSLKLGIKSLHNDTEAALIVLGDQPQIESSIVQAILNRFKSSHNPIVVPSYKMKRGHPLLISRQLWKSLLMLNTPMTLRDFLDENSKLIDYLIVNNSSVIQDLDTPDDYFRYKP
jgi:molybdenum cofactor cytidylyltransferase